MTKFDSTDPSNVTAPESSGWDLLSNGKLDSDQLRLYLQWIVQNIPDGFVSLLDPDLRYLLLEGALLARLGLDETRAIGQTAGEFWPSEVNASVVAFLNQARASSSATVELNYQNQLLSNQALSIRDEQGELEAIVVFTRDITNQRQLADAMAARARQQAVVAQLGQQALGSASLDTLMHAAVTDVAETLGVEYCKVLELLPDGKALLLRAGVGWNPAHPVGQATVSAGLESQASYTLASSEPVIVRDLRTETRFSGPPLLHDHGVISGISVIIAGRGRPYGVMGAHTTQHRPFTEHEINFLQSVANVLAMAIERQQTETALQESEQVKEQMLQSSRDCITLLDLDGGVIWVNQRGQRLLESAATSAISREVWLALWSEDRLEAAKEALTTARQGGIGKFTGTTQAKGNRPQWWDVVITPILSNNSIPERLLAVSRDITSRVEAEEALRELNETLEVKVRQRTKELETTNVELETARDLFYSLFNASPFPTSITRLEDGRFIEVNEALLRYFGWERKDVVGKTTHELYLWSGPVRRDAMLAELRQAGRIRNVEVPFRLPPGEIRTILMSFEKVLFYGETCLIGSLIDITERAEAEQQIRRLASELTLAEQRERRRIAQILHDDLQQMLVALRINLHLIEQEAADNTVADLGRIQEHLDEVIDVTRSLAVEFNAPALRSADLGRALTWLGELMRERYDLQVDLAVDGSIQIENEDFRELIFQLVRELLFNVVKHAGVGRAKLSARTDDAHLVIEVEDEGHGFDATFLDAGLPTHSFGLYNMRERLELFGGRLEVEATLGVGTRATIIVPLQIRQ